jgi:hypothetical protein
VRIQQIWQRGTDLKTAETLLRAAHTMTNRAIAGQLKALADDYERRAKRASHLGWPTHSLNRWLTPRRNDGRELAMSRLQQDPWR